MPIYLSDEARRARLVYRHRLDRSAPDMLDAVAGVLALHSSDPTSPYLAGWARVEPPFTTGDLDRALFEDRSLWRLHAMRRTLFVVDTRDGPVFQAAAGRAVAGRERARLEKWLSADLEAVDVGAWLTDVADRVEAALADGVARRTADLAEVVPELRREIAVGSGKWAGRARLSSRLLFVMAMQGKVVRARPAGSWRSSQYHWVAASTWFDHDPTSIDPRVGRANLVGRYLAAFGPATTTDIKWWSGWTLGETRLALEDAGVAAVSLEGGQGWVIDGDFEAPPLEGPVVTFLPGLDSTPMGWKERDWYLGDHGADLFDRNGNVGPTVWMDGRVVGGWGHRADGMVDYRILGDTTAGDRSLIAGRATELTEWLDGVIVTPRFRTPLEQEISG